MKNRKEKSNVFIKVTSLVLALVLSALALVSCAQDDRDAVMTCGNDKITLDMYEFMLSRTKATLARSQLGVEPTSEFWKETRKGTNLTNEEYYTKVVIDNCKNYLAALQIFEEEGMTLSKAALESIEEEIKFYIDYDGGGSEEKFDLILSKYGTNTEGLRKIYEIEAKYNAVIASLYGNNGSQIGDNVKEEYYRENYYRFKQILITNYYYEYVTDKNGDTVYFSAENGKPIYDSKGEYHYDENGSRIVDSYGVAIRYDENGKILYDKENGAPAPTKDENGKAIEHKYSEEQMKERAAAIDGIIEAAENGNFANFESEMPKWYAYAGAGEYFTDGYYLSDIESSSYDDIMADILEELKKMKVGEVKVMESDAGYHILMKYELDSGKYAENEYAAWFSNFSKSLSDKLFNDRCAKYFDKITVNEDELGKAKNIRSIGANYNY